MKEDTLGTTEITYGLSKVLKKIRHEMQMQEINKRQGMRKRRITKKEVCKELVKRCIEKKVV